MGKTTYYKFNLPNTNTRNWGKQINDNFTSIDSELNSTNQKINGLLNGQFLPISLYTNEDNKPYYLLGYNAITATKDETIDGIKIIDDSNNIVAKFVDIAEATAHNNDIFVYGTITTTPLLSFTAVGYISRLVSENFETILPHYMDTYLCFGHINQLAFGVCTTIEEKPTANGVIYKLGCRDDQLIVPTWKDDTDSIEIYPQTLGGYYHPEPTLGTNEQNYTRVPGFKSPDTLVVDVGTTGYNLSAVQQATDLTFTATKTTNTIKTSDIFTTLPTGFTWGNIQPKIEFYTKFGSSHTVIMPCYTITPVGTGADFNGHWSIAVTSQLPITITMVVTIYGTYIPQTNDE